MDKQFLVICQDDGAYYLATRTVFDNYEEACNYVDSVIDLSRNPIIVETVKPIISDLRPEV